MKRLVSYVALAACAFSLVFLVSSAAYAQVSIDHIVAWVHGACTHVASFSPPPAEDLDEIWFFPQDPEVTVEFNDTCRPTGFSGDGGPFCHEEVDQSPFGGQMPSNGIRFFLDPEDPEAISPSSGWMYFPCSPAEHETVEMAVYVHDAKLEEWTTHYVLPCDCIVGDPEPYDCTVQTLLETVEQVCGQPSAAEKIGWGTVKYLYR